MPKTTPISSRVNAKSSTSRDFPLIPAQIVTQQYSAISTSSQTVINLSFAVATANTNNFVLVINGRWLALGASNDYTFTNIQSNGTSSQITLSQSLTSGLNITATYLGVAQPPVSATSLATVQATVNSHSALIPKNYLINGGYDYSQRGTSLTVANGVSSYELDRWYVKNSLGTNGVITFSQVAGVLQGSLFGAKVQITTAPTAAQANGTELYQVIENPLSIELYGQTACFSTNIKALGNVTQVGLQFFYATTETKVTTAIGSEFLVSVNSSTFSIGQLVNQALGTAQTTAGVIGVRVRITAVSSGNTYDINNGFIVEQSIVNLGSTAASFQRAGRTPAGELVLCQRFYEKSYNLTTAPGSTGAGVNATSVQFLVGINGSASGSFIGGTQFFKVQKRVTPTMTAYETISGTINEANPLNNAGSRSGTTTFTTGNSNLSPGDSSFSYQFNNGTSFAGIFFAWTADAEI